jgi:hypothetical protein
VKLKYILQATAALNRASEFSYSMETKEVAAILNECARMAHVLERELAAMDVFVENEE